MIINNEGDVEETSQLLLKVKNYLLEHYRPVQDVKEAEIHYTTLEIYKKLQQIAPGAYEPELVASWLNEGGFTFFDYGELQFEWMMKKA